MMNGQASRTHRHRWWIEPPNGPTSWGKCEGCDEEREFRNSQGARSPRLGVAWVFGDSIAALRGGRSRSVGELSTLKSVAREPGPIRKS